jgi:hypothetical protein
MCLCVCACVCVCYTSFCHTHIALLCLLGPFVSGPTSGWNWRHLDCDSCSLFQPHECMHVLLPVYIPRSSADMAGLPDWQELLGLQQSGPGSAYDMWQLGCLLWWAASGRHLFRWEGGPDEGEGAVRGPLRRLGPLEEHLARVVCHCGPFPLQVGAALVLVLEGGDELFVMATMTAMGYNLHCQCLYGAMQDVILQEGVISAPAQGD